MASIPLLSPTGSIHKSICIDRVRVSSCCNRPLQPGLYRPKPSPPKAKADAAEGLRPDIEGSVMAQPYTRFGLGFHKRDGTAHPSAILDTRPSRSDSDFASWTKPHLWISIRKPSSSALSLWGSCQLLYLHLSQNLNLPSEHGTPANQLMPWVGLEINIT